MRLLKSGLAVLALMGVSLAAHASDALNEGDTAWILTATALVLFMTIPGLSLFYGGLVRSRNVLSVLMQCFAITCMISILWLIVGYSLAFGGGNAFIGDLSNFMLGGVIEERRLRRRAGLARTVSRGGGSSAVWTRPVVEHLSVVPEYASAASHPVQPGSTVDPDES